MSNGNGRGRLVAAVAVVGSVAVLAVVFAGPVSLGPPRWVPRPVARTVPPPLQTGAPAPALPARGGGALAHVLGLVLEAVLLLVAAALAAVLLRWLVRRVIGRRRRVGRRVREDAPALVAGTEPTVAAPVLQRGIVRALQILDDGARAPRDAVVAAWLGLEDAAVLAGARRAAAETPTEYTARIIRRFDTDHAAADTLVGLYQGVRFGARDADAADVARARDCLVRLQRSWHDDERATAGPVSGGEGT